MPNYLTFTKQFEKRRKGSDHKVYSRGAVHMHKEGDGFVFYMLGQRYRYNEETKKYERYRTAKTAFARMTPGSILTLLDTCDGLVGSQGMNNVWSKLFGGNVFSDAGKYKNYKHKLRYSPTYSTRKDSVPFAVGLVIDKNTNKILSAADDERLTTDRAKNKHVYEHTRQVTKVIDVLSRVASLNRLDAALALGLIDQKTFDEQVAKNRTHFWPWELKNKMRNALDTVDLSITDDEGVLYKQAMAAYLEASTKVLGMSPYYVDNSGAYLRYSDEEMVRRNRQAELRLAAKLLREKLKHKHSTFDKEVITYKNAA